jgi:hypothetical protein
VKAIKTYILPATATLPKRIKAVGSKRLGPVIISYDHPHFTDLSDDEIHAFAAREFATLHKWNWHFVSGYLKMDKCRVHVFLPNRITTLLEMAGGKTWAL